MASLCPATGAPLCTSRTPSAIPRARKRSVKQLPSNFRSIERLLGWALHSPSLPFPCLPMPSHNNKKQPCCQRPSDTMVARGALTPGCRPCHPANRVLESSRSLFLLLGLMLSLHVLICSASLCFPRTPPPLRHLEASSQNATESACALQVHLPTGACLKSCLA